MNKKKLNNSTLYKENIYSYIVKMFNFFQKRGNIKDERRKNI